MPEHRRMISVFAVAALSAALVLPGAASAQGPGGGPGGPGGQGGGRQGFRRQVNIASLPVATLEKALGLNASQKAKVQQIRDRYIKESTPLRPQPGAMPDRNNMQKLRELSRAAATEIEALLSAPQKEKLTAVREELGLYRLAGIPFGLYGQIGLTEAQKKKLKDLQAEAAGRMGGPGGGPGAAAPGGPQAGARAGGQRAAPRAPGAPGAGPGAGPGPGGPMAGGPNMQGMMQAFQQIRAKAEAILTPAQKAKVEKYYKDHPNERPRFGFGGGPGGGGPGGGGPGTPGGAGRGQRRP